MGAVGHTAPRLVERQGEVEQIERVVAAAQSRGGGFVWIEGSAGIGKSRLLGAVRECAENSGFTALCARGGELERDFAFGVVRQLLEQRLLGATPAEREELLSGAAELAAPALGLSSGEQAQAPGDVSFPVVHGLYWLVANLAAQQPLLLEIDDLHWADSPTLRFLLHLAPRLEGSGILISAAARPGEPAADATLLAKLAADPVTDVIAPGPLSRDGISALISEVMGRESEEEFASACHSASGGNPFFALAILRELSADGIAPDARAAPSILDAGPNAVERTLVMRLAQLPTACAPLARAVATLGARAELAHAAELAELDPEAAGAAADALAAVEILAPQRPLTFIHPVVREAIYADIGPSERAALHARAAAVLATGGVEPAEYAPHLLAAEPSGDADVVAGLRAAAKDALGQGAADLARRYLMRALAEPADGDARLSCLADIGVAEWLTGEPGPAVEHLGEAVAGTTDPLLKAERTVALARSIFYTGQVPLAVETLERGAAEAAEQGATGEAIERLEAEVCSIGMLSPLTVDRALVRIEALGEPKAESLGDLLALTSLASRQWMTGTAARAAEFGELALTDGRLAKAEGADSVAVMQVAWVLSVADRQERAGEVAAEMLEQARRRGSTFGYATWRAMTALNAISRGDLVAAEAEARAGLEVTDVPLFSRVSIYSMLALALIEQGELDEAEAAVTESGCGPYLPPMIHMNMAFYARGRLRLAQGRHEEALKDFVEFGERDRQCRLGSPAFAWRTGAVSALRTLGDRDQAQKMAAEQLAVAKHWNASSAIGGAMYSVALAAEDDETEALLREAIEVLADCPDRLTHAKALVELGATIRRAGRRAEAREPLRAGLEVARRCGARLLIKRAYEELVTAGARPRRLMFSGLESLTASEHRVASRAAEGMSNREIAQELFITIKTVENHLGRAYSKLDIAGREELADALQGDGSGDE